MDSDNVKRTSKAPWHIPILGLVIIIFVLLANWWFLKDFTDDKRGTFGDMFGAANAFFSGLALIGVVYAIRLQGKEISDQVKELARSSEAQTAMFKLMQSEFNILKEERNDTIKMRKPQFNWQLRPFAKEENKYRLFGRLFDEKCYGLKFGTLTFSEDGSEEVESKYIPPEVNRNSAGVWWDFILVPASTVSGWLIFKDKTDLEYKMEFEFDPSKPEGQQFKCEENLKT